MGGGPGGLVLPWPGRAHCSGSVRGAFVLIPSGPARPCLRLVCAESLGGHPAQLVHRACSPAPREQSVGVEADLSLFPTVRPTQNARLVGAGPPREAWGKQVLLDFSSLICPKVGLVGWECDSGWLELRRDPSFWTGALGARAGGQIQGTAGEEDPSSYMRRRSWLTPGWGRMEQTQTACQRL
uniref:Uncharacterized protein n=1 Tax=Molossus molossus TaxID=27622 RepID=A0A7J8BJA0_MOLMO|nr:hypothetical protein HJG59_010211 [Molossus molossus]